MFPSTPSCSNLSPMQCLGLSYNVRVPAVYFPNAVIASPVSWLCLCIICFQHVPGDFAKFPSVPLEVPFPGCSNTRGSLWTPCQDPSLFHRAQLSLRNRRLPGLFLSLLSRTDGEYKHPVAHVCLLIPVENRVWCSFQTAQQATVWKEKTGTVTSAPLK